MKSVRVRLKDRVDMNWTKKRYSYLCPVKNIEVGDYVLLDSRKGNRFAVGIVTKVKEANAYTAYAYVICKLPVKELDKRLDFIQKKRLNNLTEIRKTATIKSQKELVQETEEKK